MKMGTVLFFCQKNLEKRSLSKAKKNRTVPIFGIANIIGWPVAYLAMRALLNNYYFRISLGPQYFLLVGILSFSVAALTTAILAVRAAVANPVDSLRYE